MFINGTWGPTAKTGSGALRTSWTLELKCCFHSGHWGLAASSRVRNGDSTHLLPTGKVLIASYRSGSFQFCRKQTNKENMQEATQKTWEGPLQPDGRSFKQTWTSKLFVDLLRKENVENRSSTGSIHFPTLKLRVFVLLLGVMSAPPHLSSYIQSPLESRPSSVSENWTERDLIHQKMVNSSFNQWSQFSRRFFAVRMPPCGAFMNAHPAGGEHTGPAPDPQVAQRKKIVLLLWIYRFLLVATCGR